MDCRGAGTLPHTRLKCPRRDRPRDLHLESDEFDAEQMEPGELSRQGAARVFRHRVLHRKPLGAQHCDSTVIR